MFTTILARLAGFTLLAFGLVAGIGGIAFGFQTAAFNSRAKITEGEIVRFESRAGKGGLKSYPVFFYRDSTGHRWEGSGSRSSAKFSLGQKVQVFYDPEEPMVSVDDTSWRAWFGSIFITVWGFGLASGGWRLIRGKTEPNKSTTDMHLLRLSIGPGAGRRHS